MLLAEKLPLNQYEIGTTINKTNPRRVKRLQGKLVLVLGLLLLTVIGNIIVQGLVIQQNQKIQFWQKKIDEKQRELGKLRIEIAGLESFERIQKIAQDELGMREAGPQDYNLIKSAPNYQNRVIPSTEYLAKVSNQVDLWGENFLVVWRNRKNYG